MDENEGKFQDNATLLDFAELVMVGSFFLALGVGLAMLLYVIW